MFTHSHHIKKSSLFNPSVKRSETAINHDSTNSFSPSSEFNRAAIQRDSQKFREITDLRARGILK